MNVICFIIETVKLVKVLSGFSPLLSLCLSPSVGCRPQLQLQVDQTEGLEGWDTVNDHHYCLCQRTVAG